MQVADAVPRSQTKAGLRHRYKMSGASHQQPQAGCSGWPSCVLNPPARPVQHAFAWSWPGEFCKRCEQCSSTSHWRTFTKLLNQEVEPPAPYSSMTWWGLQRVRNSTHAQPGQEPHCTSYAGGPLATKGSSASMQAHSKKVSTVTTSSKLIHACGGQAQRSASA